ncbi:hypothetical protein [Streptomyces sp. NPDC058698]|uniref:hypothetical protein n=1 Tax=Streptomyces sp. NPDC058698 TaxID=3346606 RepID=UPI003650D2EE
MSEKLWAGLLETGWAARLRTEDGRTRFRLHYYGQRFEGLIVDDALPALVYAVTGSGQRILLFDGAAHGYDAMFCDSRDADGLRARRAAFDALSITVVNARHRATDAVSEELA